MHTCCAKVSTVSTETGKQEMIGYVVDETDTELHVHLSNNTWMMFPRGVSCSDTGKYTFETSNRYTRSIIQVWPVQFVIYDSGLSDMTVVRYCYSKTTNVLCENFCS